MIIEAMIEMRLARRYDSAYRLALLAAGRSYEETRPLVGRLSEPQQKALLSRIFAVPFMVSVVEQFDNKVDYKTYFDRVIEQHSRHEKTSWLYCTDGRYSCSEHEDFTGDFNHRDTLVKFGHGFQNGFGGNTLSLWKERAPSLFL